MQRPTWLTPWACLRLYGLMQLACMAWLLATHWQAIANPTPQPAPPGGRRAALTAPASAAIPRDAVRHQLTLKREAHQVWGLGAPVATFAAQVHQESRWRTNAASPVGAQGMAQFMPATARWISGIDGQLATGDTHNPTWALRALVIYNKWLWDRIKAFDDCNRMAFTLASYNSGLGTVQKKVRATCPQGGSCAWFGQAELSPAGQSPANHAETTHYAQVILRRYEPIYAQAGWGAGSCL